MTNDIRRLAAEAYESLRTAAGDVEAIEDRFGGYDRCVALSFRGQIDVMLREIARETLRAYGIDRIDRGEMPLDGIAARLRLESCALSLGNAELVIEPTVVEEATWVLYEEARP